MQRATFRWGMSTAMVAISVATALATTHHASLVDVLLDSTTGVLAIAGVVLVVARLLLSPLEQPHRLAWQAVLAILALVALAELSEPFSEASELRLGIDNIDDVILLAVAPVALWFFERFERVPQVPRRLVLAGFALQAGAMVMDFFDDGTGVGRSYMFQLANGVDLAQALSMIAYFGAVAWVVLDVRQRFIAESDIDLRSSGVIPTRIRDGLYPPPFFVGRHVPPNDTAAGRIHRLCNAALWRSRDLIGMLLNLALIVSWPMVASIRAIKAIRKLGDVIQEATGKTKLEQFLEQLRLAVDHRIPPVYYYVYELHRNAKRWSPGHYLMRYETKEIAFRLLYPRATEFSSPTPLKNKLEFAHRCADWDLPHAPVIMAFSDGQRVVGQAFDDRLPMRDVFVKPVFGKGGCGSERWRAMNDGRFRSMLGEHMTEAELLARVARLSEAEPYLIQLALENHPSILDLSAGALSTVRMLTLRNEKGEFEVTNAVLRMAVDARSSVDNFHAGGIAADIDIKTGRLGYATDLGRGTGSAWHDRHPLTDAQIEGRQLPMWQQTVDLAVRAHRAFSDYALIGWDIAILEDGPSLVEGNRGPDVDILQRTADRPIGNGRFGELLAWNLERKLSGRQAGSRTSYEADKKLR